MTRISLPPIAAPAFAQDGVRPVNLRTDLRPLADLIELVFADSMDSSGRSAIREMRYLSGLGYGLKLIARLNELALGISLGFVYVSDGKLVGNVSVYPASYPAGFGETWILANVGVHPDYQGRGMAQELMRASLEMIRWRGAGRVILQVNYQNEAALRSTNDTVSFMSAPGKFGGAAGFFALPHPANATCRLTARGRATGRLSTPWRKLRVPIAAVGWAG